MRSNEQLKQQAPLDRRAFWRILSTTFLGFLCYLSIGLPLASLTQFVHHTLGYNLIVAGLVISMQSLATVLFRPLLGRISDRVGPKKAVVRGLAVCGFSGMMLIAAGDAVQQPVLSLCLLFASRLVLGIGEGAVATGATTWGLARVGSEHSTHVLSWAGVASYGALALGAPLGVEMAAAHGIAAVGIAVTVVGLGGAAVAQMLGVAKVAHGERLELSRVLGRVLPYGMVLALATGGFATIATFVTLYFQNQHWAHATLPISLFGGCFVLVRLVGSNWINNHGGLRVATASMLVETLGLACLCLAHSSAVAMTGAAVAGAGFALVFPAIGVEAVKVVTLADRGAALGVYTAFLDLSLGITGPLAGVAIHHWGYVSAFALAAAAAIAGSGGALLTERARTWAGDTVEYERKAA